MGGQGELFLENAKESFENAKKVVQDTLNSEHKIEDEYIEEKKVEEVAKKPSQFIGDPIKLLVQKEKKEVPDDEADKKEEVKKEGGEEPMIEDVTDEIEDVTDKIKEATN